MKLEVNQQILSENVTKDMIAESINTLRPDEEAIIILSESDDIFLQAAGIPKTGLMMSYINRVKGDDLQSKNLKLSPQTIERVFKQFLEGNVKWRQSIAWQKTSDIKAEPTEKPQVSRKTKGLLFGCFLYLTFAFPLLAIGLDTLIKEVVFKPMCAQHGLPVQDYVHSGGEFIQGTFQRPQCIFAGAVRIDLSDIVGWNVIWLDSFMRVMVGILPFTIPAVIGLYFIMQYARQKKKNDMAMTSS